MKRLTISLAVMALGFAGNAWAQLSGTTKDGYAACLTKEWLNDFVSFAVAKDEGSIQAYLDENKCISMKGGLRVTVTHAGLTQVEFAFMGVKLWTVPEALKID